jgi:hypothetical protein
MSDVRVLHNRWAAFDGMVWDLPNDAMGELAWRLRYQRPTDPKDAMAASSIIESYMQLVRVNTVKDRNHNVAHIRKALRSTNDAGPDHGG